MRTLSLCRFCKATQRTRNILSPDPRDAQVIQGRAVTGMGLERAFEGTDGVIHQVLFQQDQPEIIVSFGMCRLQGNGLPVRVGRRIEPALCFQHHAEIVMTLGMIRVERQHLFVRRLCVRQSSEFFIGVPEVRARFDVARVELNRPAVGLNRVGEESRPLEHDTMVETIDGVTRIGRACLGQAGEGVAEVAAPVQQQTETVQGLRLDGHPFEQLLIASLRIVQAAGLMVHLGFTQTGQRRGCAAGIAPM